LRPALLFCRYQPSLATHTSSFASFAGQIYMTTANAWAAHSAQSPFAHFSFQRRALEPQDVRIDILYCGICHSDVHFARGEWGDPRYPCVPGHEIVGRVSAVGESVARFQPGDLVGRSEEHTSELQSLLRNSYAVFCLKNQKTNDG